MIVMLSKTLNVIGFYFFSSLTLTYAAVFVIPYTGSIVGSVQKVSSETNETIADVGRRFGVGYYEMVRANPQVDAVYSLPARTSLTIPSQFILPAGSKEGIVINLAEYRLYYYPPDENIVITFPVGIVKKGWNTPIGNTTIIAKVTHPTWRPTAKILAAAEQIGAPLPEVVPSGPNNPLGEYALRLGWSSVLIHGANRADGIGARVSAGCIRMLPEDIEYLFNNIKTGTKVRVINDPIKIGRMNGSFFVQVYSPLSEEKNIHLDHLLSKKLSGLNLPIKSNESITRELAHPTGLVKQII